jgi:hypothetical protein
LVDAFFVMAYDVNQGPAQGDVNSDADADYIAQYSSVAGASKVILGLPLFGYDEPTTGPDLGDAATGPSHPVSYSEAAGSGPTYWDGAAQTAWTSYQDGSQWHQVFFDNANTFAGKVQQAEAAHLLGVGVWALGMEGIDDSVLAVLDGGVAPLRTPPGGPTAPAGSGGSPNAATTGASGAGSVTSTTSGHHKKSGGTGTATTVTTAPPSRTTTTTAPPGSTTSSSVPTSSTTTTTQGGSPSDPTTTTSPAG